MGTADGRARDVLTMSNVIRARGLGKIFRASSSAYRRSVLRVIREAWTGADGRKEFRALNGVDFDVSAGEALAVVGPNGAGKSTLLLLLAGILEKSEGELLVSARASLFFPFGASLQPRLTVRHNFDLAAALLGLSRRDFKKRFPEILDFSGLESRLEDRLGELSTGLAARLAFSVAVHIEQEIVLADEMLSVGDIAFQARCRAALGRLRREGASLVLATHDMEAARALCPRAVYLREGCVRAAGPTDGVVRRFEDESRAGEAGAR